MSLLKPTVDKVERFSLEVANQEMEKLRSRIDDLECILNRELDKKLDMEQYHNLRGRVNDLNDRLNALVLKINHDSDCMTNALESISQILLAMFARGVNATEVEKDHLLALDAEINELQTYNKYWYG